MRIAGKGKTIPLTTYLPVAYEFLLRSSSCDKGWVVEDGRIFTEDSNGNFVSLPLSTLESMIQGQRNILRDLENARACAISKGEK